MDDDVDDPGGLDPGGLDPAARTRRLWRRVGVVVASLLALGGLALVAFVVLTLIAFNDWASNK